MEINTKQSSLLSSLQSILAPDAILTGDAVHERSSGIWGPSGTLAADILVRPASTDEVSRILATCHEYHQPVVVHGGLTGVVEGAKA
ncbi:MAG: FAD-binding protein, partial [Gammaproteobacteria bacterium]|nr:FAD-binding protein [Gammaproteobacteria bacterium]